MANILVVDDELGIRDLLLEILNDEGHAVELADSASSARAARQRCADPFDLILLDIWMPDTDGVTLLKEWSASGQLCMPVIMMSGHATIDTAVEATKIGAHAFLEKPITLQKLLKAVNEGLERNARQKAFRSAMPAAAAMKLMGLPPTAPNEAVASPSPIAAVTPLVVARPPGPAAEQSFVLDMPLREARDVFEKAYFEFHLSQELGSMTRVAEKTGLERTHLYRKLKQLGVDLSRNKRAVNA
ncbi:MAG: response regulator [Brachymonas sp.]|jgi:DNA-binding NtrC family response regulator